MPRRHPQKFASSGPVPGFVEVGRVQTPHGIKGEVQVAISSDVPHRFAPGGTLFLQGTGYSIQHSRRRGDAVVLKLKGLDSREAAEGFRGCLVEVPEVEVPPAQEGHYYYFQILGMAVYTVEEEFLGTVEEIIPTGSNDVYVVRKGEEEVLVPAREEVVMGIDAEGKRMTVSLPQGLR